MGHLGAEQIYNQILSCRPMQMQPMLDSIYLILIRPPVFVFGLIFSTILSINLVSATDKRADRLRTAQQVAQASICLRRQSSTARMAYISNAQYVQKQKATSTLL